MTNNAPTRRRLLRAITILVIFVAISAVIAVNVGYQKLRWSDLWHDDMTRAVLFELRLPRVVMAALIGSTLALVGAALQALFRNSLADPFVLGVSGGGALGATIAITLGWGSQLLGLPVVFVCAFAGAGAAVLVSYRIARGTGDIILPGALLLTGVVINLIANASIITIQYLTDYTRALQILRWLIGNLDVIGFGLISRMLIFLVPTWVVLLAFAGELHLFAIDQESAAGLGVNVKRLERWVYAFSCLGVGVTVAAGGMIGFIGLIVPHVVRLLFGQDVRVVLPCSALLGAAFLMLTDALARTILGQAELPVGAVTGVLGGPFFLLLLHRQQRQSTLGF